MVSNKFSIPIFFFAEISTVMTSPPYFSAITSCCISSLITFSGFAPGTSILLIATIIGTLAALAWSIASIVWGITPSSAATTKTTISVTLAPLALIAEKASCPGVSIKVIFWPLNSLT